MQYGNPGSRLQYFVDPSFPALDSVDVFVISKAEQPRGETTEVDDFVADEDLSVPILKGPFSFQDLNAMESMNILDEVHYVYVLTKAIKTRTEVGQAH